MQGKIALEEHFAIEETLGSSEGPHGAAEVWKELKSNLLDIQDTRLARMDKLGIEMAVLSLNAPVLQAMTERKEAAELANRANDFLAEQVVKRPDRFRGFAALAMQVPDLADF